jgi:hypothetical protein
MTDDIYLQLAHDRPHEAKLGGALITMVDPPRGFEAAYNRWYEDDHFYAGATAGPWVFAGRRFVATRDMRRLRYPSEPRGYSTADGCYISLYWHTAGHSTDVERWALEALLGEFLPGGRTFMFEELKHTYTAFHDFAFAHVADPSPMQAVHALDHPYPGIAVELVDAESPGQRPELLAWLESTFLPAKAGEGLVGQCVAFTPRPFRAELADKRGWKDQDPLRRVCLIWFLRQDPRHAWPRAFATHEADLGEGGASLRLLAPFVPTSPGTDRYVDELGVGTL